MTSNQRVRFVEFERGQIDMETGEFPMVLATDGEASDGDILSIEGAQFTSRAPLQLSHINDPTATLGSVSGFRRDMTGSPKKLKARGQIELTGDGPNAEIRRDLAHMIQQGHVTGISVRWEPIKYMPRTQLPKEHYAHVGENEKDWRKRNGFYHEKWRVLEGSVVAIQADKAAMVGRAEQTEGAVSQFWRAMAEDAKTPEELTRQIAPPAPEPEPDPEEQTAPVVTKEARLAALAAQIREMREQDGIELDAISSIVEAQREAATPPPDPREAQISALTARLEALEGRVSEGAPPPPIRTVQDIFDQIDERVARSRENVIATAKRAIDARRGKIPQGLSYRKQLQAEVDALIREAKSDEASSHEALLERLESLVTEARARHKTARDEGSNDE